MSENGNRTVVVTGASAGVGRAVALAFARHGWRVALIARSPAGLESAKRELEAAGAQAAVFPADVADANAVFAAARKIVALWGSIDVWVNDAMVSVFAPIAATTPEEFRRVTEVTYLGYVHGTLAALEHMRPRNAGTIVQVGSALSYRAIPLQAPYCAAKFAIRGFTDALRCELRHDRSAVRITMVQLPAVNTPQFDWSRNKIGFRAQPVPPIHQPEPVGEAIYRAALSRSRERWLGWSSAKVILGQMFAPGLLDRLLAAKGYTAQHTSEPQPPDQPDNLFAPVAYGHATHGWFDERAKARVATIDPAVLRAATAFAISAVVVFLIRRL